MLLENNEIFWNRLISTYMALFSYFFVMKIVDSTPPATGSTLLQ